MIAAAIASLLIAGTILAPTQASATSQRKSSPQFNNLNDNTNDNTSTAKSRSSSSGFTDTASLKCAIELLTNATVVVDAIRTVSERTKGDANKQTEEEERAKKKVEYNNMQSGFLIF
jgi:hypothetical protein